MTFKSGCSGNVNGRPRGTGYRQQLFNTLVAPHKDELFAKGISLALAGNEAMLRLFLERMMPAKPVDEHVILDIPSDLKNASNILEYGETALRGIANGTLTPQQAKIIMATIEGQRKNIEISEIEARVAAMEQVLNQRKFKEKNNAKRQSKGLPTYYPTGTR